MRYVKSRLSYDRRDFAYRIYSTDALFAIAMNTSQTGRMKFEKRYAEILNLTDNSKTDARSAEEIAIDIITHAGLETSMNESS